MKIKTNSKSLFKVFIAIFFPLLLAVGGFVFKSTPDQAYAATGTVSCGNVYSSVANFTLSNQADFGGLAAGIKLTPDPYNYDTDSTLSGSVKYNLSESTTTVLMHSLEPSTSYTVDYMLSDGTVLSSTTCTTTDTSPSFDATLYLYSVDGVVVNKDADTYASATEVPEGSDLVYRYEVSSTSDQPIGLSLDGSSTMTPQISDVKSGAENFDSIIGGDTDNDGNLDPGETWMIEKQYTNITNSDEKEDSVDILGDNLPDTMYREVLLVFDAGGSNFAKDASVEFVKVKDRVVGCDDPDATNYNADVTDADNTTCTYFDLALKKTTTATTASPGENVTFTISVVNQGDVAATEIEITDYIPAGMSLSSSNTLNWTLQDSKATYTIPGTLDAGESTTVDIVLRVNNPFTGSSSQLVNEAEISSAKDEDGNSVKDRDSTPDDNMDNDCGGEVNTATDDKLDGTGEGDNCDEDDHDPEDISVTLYPSIDLEKVVGTPDGDQYDADTASERVAVATGANVPVTIYITNTGSTALMLNEGQPEVDDVCENLTLYDKGDEDSLDILSVNEVWTYTCTVPNVRAAGDCGASVKANPVNDDGTDIAILGDVSDNDPIYIGPGGNLYGTENTTETGGALEETGQSTATTAVIGASFVLAALATYLLSVKPQLRFALPKTSLDLNDKLNSLQENIKGKVFKTNTSSVKSETAGNKQNRFTQTRVREQQTKESAIEGRDGVLFKV